MPIQIFVKDIKGQVDLTLHPEPTDSVWDLQGQIKDRTDIPQDDQRLVYGGKQLSSSSSLAYYEIKDHSTVHLLHAKERIAATRHVSASQRNTTAKNTVFTASSTSVLPPESRRLPAEPPRIITHTSFDDDSDIIDPVNYYKRLDTLSNSVAERSEFKRCHGVYERFDMQAQSVDEATGGENIPDWMWLAMKRRQFDASKELESVNTILIDLWKTCMMSVSILSSLKECRDNGFCGSSFNILLDHTAMGVAELVRIDISDVEAIQRRIVTAIEQLLDVEDKDSIRTQNRLVALVVVSCRDLLRRLGLVLETTDMSMTAMLATCRMTVVILDLGLISYMGSHGLRFDQDYLRREVTSFAVAWKDSPFSFQCSLTQLACLHKFLDERQVWVFSLQLRGAAMEMIDGRQPTSILTRMKEFSDVWGPVYAVPDSSDRKKIKQYNVSKGIICKTSKKLGFRGAIKCHWYNEQTWMTPLRRLKNQLSPSLSLSLSHDDLLLIGDEMMENTECHYKLHGFVESYGNSLQELGTRESSWRWDTRGASIAISGTLRISISGTQKRIPSTPLKQKIIDAWQSAPERRNPQVLNHYLGVEVSHCTGNARRIPVKQLLCLKPISLLLNQQFPSWRYSAWGPALKAALEERDGQSGNDAIVALWITFEKYRPKIAQLVCYALDILSPTGLQGSGLKVAFLNHGQELMLNLSVENNTWGLLLKDTTSTAAFALINEICLQCELPKDKAARCNLCNSLPSLTVLQSEISFEDRSQTWKRVSIKAVGETFRKIDAASPRPVFLSSESALIKFVATASMRNDMVEGREVRDQSFLWGGISTTYIQASAKSYGGMPTRRKSAYARRRIAEAADLTMPDLEGPYQLSADRRSRSPLGLRFEAGAISRGSNQRTATHTISAQGALHQNIFPTLRPLDLTSMADKIENTEVAESIEQRIKTKRRRAN